MKNLKKYIAVLLIMIIAVSLCACTKKQAQNVGYKVYRSSPVGVEIEYPDFWEVTDNEKERTVAFAPPLEGFGDEFRDSVTIIVKELADDEMAYDEYVRQYIDSLPKTMANYLLVSENDVKVGNYTAYRVVFESGDDEGIIRFQQTFIKSGKYVYIYSFIAEPKSYDYFDANSRIMLSTFKALRK